MFTYKDKVHVEYVEIMEFAGSTIKLDAGIIYGLISLASNFSSSTVYSMILCSSWLS